MPRDPASQRARGLLLRSLSALAADDPARARALALEASRELGDVLEGTGDVMVRIHHVLERMKPEGG